MIPITPDLRNLLEIVEQTRCQIPQGEWSPTLLIIKCLFPGIASKRAAATARNGGGQTALFPNVAVVCTGIATKRNGEPPVRL